MELAPNNSLLFLLHNSESVVPRAGKRSQADFHIIAEMN